MKAQQDETVESFDWQWTKKNVFDSEDDLYRRLFESRHVWHDFYDNKVVADVGSGVGRNTWALTRFTNASKIISVELARESLEKQRQYITDPRVQFLHGDLGVVKFRADVIYCAGVIQHVADPFAAVRNLVDNLNEGGELIISFYMVTPKTIALQPLRAMLSRLGPRQLWALTPLLAPIFVLGTGGPKMGYRNAMHTAYDWFGSHEYQKYFTPAEVHRCFREAGIEDRNILRIDQGLFRARKGHFPHRLSDKRHPF